jgi:hypothetical protein
VSTLALRPSASTNRLGALRAPGRAAVTSAALSLIAAWIHFAYASSHWRDWWAYGMFFVVTGVFQGLLAPAILRWPRNTWVVLTGIAGNFAIVGMYVYSRTIGVPMGPHTGVAERTGAIDLGCTAMEIVLMGVLMSMLGQRTRRGIANALLLVGALLWVGRLTGRLP